MWPSRLRANCLQQLALFFPAHRVIKYSTCHSKNKDKGFGEMSNFKPCAAIMPLAIEACELAVFSGRLPFMG
jgi:hypothetical protein